MTTSTSIYARGYADFAKAADWAGKLRIAENKLRRRIRKWCHPKLFFGDLKVWVFRRRMRRKLRQRFTHEGALYFAGQGDREKS